MDAKKKDSPDKILAVPGATGNSKKGLLNMSFTHRFEFQAPTTL